MSRAKLIIYGVSEQIHDDLCNIADNHTVSFSDFMRPHLRKIRDSYSEEMRKPTDKNIAKSNRKNEKAAKEIADMCLPCSAENWNKIYVSCKKVLDK